MTADAIVRRNRANAARSTGPRTRAGKAVVAQNARRHGATAKLDPERVRLWLRIILAAPDLAAETMTAHDRRTGLAFALAEAEVRYAIAAQALRDFEMGKTFRTVQAQATWDDPVAALSSLMEDLRSVRAWSSSHDTVAFFRSSAGKAGDGGHQRRLLQRYLGAAQNRRNRAFAAWVLHQTPEGEG